MSRLETKRSSLAIDSNKGTNSSSLKLPQKTRSGSTTPLRRPSSSKVVGKKELYETLREYDRRNGSKQRYLASIVDKITDFNSDALGHFNNEYSEFDQRLSDSLDTFQTQVENIQALKEQAKQLVKTFESDISSTEVAFDSDLKELKQWSPPKDKADAMEEQIVQLKDILATSKEKLKRLDEELREVEERNNRDNRQLNTTIRGTVLCSAVIVLLLSYYLFS